MSMFWNEQKTVTNGFAKYFEEVRKYPSSAIKTVVTDVPAILGQAIACEMNLFSELGNKNLERQWEQMLALIALYQVKNIPLHAYKLELYNNNEQPFLNVAYRYHLRERDVFENSDWHSCFLITLDQYKKDEHGQSYIAEQNLGIVTPFTLFAPARDFDDCLYEMNSDNDLVLKEEFSWLEYLLNAEIADTKNERDELIIPYFLKYLEHIRSFPPGGNKEAHRKIMDQLYSLEQRIRPKYKQSPVLNLSSFELANTAAVNKLSTSITFGDNAKVVDRVLYYSLFQTEPDRKFLLDFRCPDIFEEKLILINQRHLNYQYSDAFQHFQQRRKYQITADGLAPTPSPVSVHSVISKRSVGRGQLELSGYSALIPFKKGFMDEFLKPEHMGLLASGIMANINIFYDVKEDKEYFEVEFIIDKNDNDFAFVFKKTYDRKQIIELFNSDLPTISIFPENHFISRRWQCNYVAIAEKKGFNYKLTLGEGEPFENSSDEFIYKNFRNSYFLPARCQSGDREILNYFILPCQSVVTSAEKAVVSVDFGTSNTYIYITLGDETLGLSGSRTLCRGHQPNSSWLHETFFAPTDARELDNIIPTYILAQTDLQKNNLQRNEYKIIKNANTLNINYKSSAVSILGRKEYANLKWPEQNEEEQTLNKNLVIQFLNQLVTQVAASVYKHGCEEMEIFFSYPLVFDEDHIQKYLQNWKNVCDVCQSETGLRLEINDQIRDRTENLQECVATAKYFISKHQENIQQGELFVIIDIGGATSDISFVQKEDHNYSICHTSVKFAGQSIVFNTANLDFLIPWMREAMINPSGITSPSPFVVNLLNQLDKADENKNKIIMLEQIIGNIINKDPTTLAHIHSIEGDRETRLLFDIMRFKLECLMQLIGIALKYKRLAENKDRKISIFLAGNGSRLFKFTSHIHSEYDRLINNKRYLDAFAEGLGRDTSANIGLMFSNECKQEVAQGLVQTDIRFEKELETLFALEDLAIRTEDLQIVARKAAKLKDAIAGDWKNLKTLQDVFEAIGKVGF